MTAAISFTADPISPTFPSGSDLVLVYDEVLKYISSEGDSAELCTVAD